MEFCYILGTILDKEGCIILKKMNRSPHRGEPEHKPVEYRGGQLLVNATGKSEAGQREEWCY